VRDHGIGEQDVIGPTQKNSNRVFTTSGAEHFTHNTAQSWACASAQIDLCAEAVFFTKADSLASEILMRRMRKIDVGSLLFRIRTKRVAERVATARVILIFTVHES
jgi:hypothetical protein